MPVQLSNRASQPRGYDKDVDIVIVIVDTDLLSIRHEEHGETRPSRDEEFVSDSHPSYPDRNEGTHGTSEQEDD